MGIGRTRYWKGREPERHKPEGYNVGGEKKACRGEEDWHVVKGKILPGLAKCPQYFRVWYTFNNPNIVQHLRWLKYNLLNWVLSFSFDPKHQFKYFFFPDML